MNLRESDPAVMVGGVCLVMLLFAAMAVIVITLHFCWK